MPLVSVDEINLHHITVGSGPDVIMVHGWLGNLAVWHLNIAPKLRSHFRLTTYDLRGHGYSSVPASGYTADDMAEDLRGLMDALEIQHASLVGHSFGADVCLSFALRYPDRVNRLCALEPGLAALVEERKRADWPGWDYWVAKLEEVGLEIPEDKRRDWEYLLEVSLNTTKFYGPARGLPRKRGPLINLIRNTSLLRDYEVVGALTRESVRSIQTPILLVYGEHSHFLGTYRFLKENLPNNKATLLPGGEHFGPLEQPETLSELMLDFLTASDASEPLARGAASGD